MKNIIGLEKQNEKPLLFPEEIEKYFSEGNIVINLYPQDIISEQEQGIIDFKATSATQYYEYITSEITFWTKVDPGNKLNAITNKGKFQEAKNQFDYAMRNIGSPSTFKQYLDRSVANVSKQTLSSKTKLAQILIQYIDKPALFLDGFRIGMRVNGSSNFSINTDMLQGFLAAMSYRDCYKGYVQVAEEHMTSFTTHAKKATDNFVSLNKNYTNAFYEQEKRLKEFSDKTNAYLNEFKTKAEMQFQEANTRRDELENVYREKLRIEGPTDYWKKLKKNYSIQGYAWLGGSILLAAGIITLLIITLTEEWVVFSNESNWMENLKNSAIITTIASIGVYVLRLLTKISLSSHHLADDARERENLAHFYLALIEKGAVTDKERALVLNALFSRSDSGLLKGDAAPSMPSNVSDIMEVIKKQGSK